VKIFDKTSIYKAIISQEKNQNKKATNGNQIKLQASLKASANSHFLFLALLRSTKS
jgi:hypothetical protein